MPAKADLSPVFQLKVTLMESKPAIWRRIQVRGSTTLPKLHLILQVVMGWENYHLHQFKVGDICYSIPDPEWDMYIVSENRVKLGEIITALKQRFVYEYDLGDGWEHEILVENVLLPEPGVHYPVCLEGKRACPPEDVGGMGLYPEFVKAIRNPRHPEHEDMLGWVGGSFDPLAFDLDAVNQELRRL